MCMFVPANYSGEITDSQRLVTRIVIHCLSGSVCMLVPGNYSGEVTDSQRLV